jgi:hypothetical protein
MNIDGHATDLRRPFNREMSCPTKSITYDYEQRVGFLFMEAGSRCDKFGCIRTFERIDIKVRFIMTFAGNVPGAAYRIDERGEWLTLMPDEMQRRLTSDELARILAMMPHANSAAAGDSF